MGLELVREYRFTVLNADFFVPTKLYGKLWALGAEALVAGGLGVTCQ